MLVDTHQHLFDRDRLPYAWCDGVPALARRRLDEHYHEAAATSATPVTATLFVEGNVDSASASQETDWALGLAERAGSRIRGVIAAAFPERADFTAQLAPFRSRSALKGIRRVLHTAPTGLAGTKQFSRNVARLAEYGLTFDLCVNYMQLIEARTLAASCPEVTFILDHCGSPPIGSDRMAIWRENFARLAALPNVTCKLSGLLGLAPAGQRNAVATYVPVFECAVTHFGWERLMWGSDWPLCDLAGSLDAWGRITESLVSSASPAQRDALFQANATRIYRLS